MPRSSVKTRDARRFEALGGVVWIQAIGDGPTQGPGRAESAIRDLQCRLTRFETNSELGRLNRDPRSSVPASPIMLRFAGVVGYAGKLSGGLVDATCLDAVELAGYTESIDPEETQRQASVLPASLVETVGNAVKPTPILDGMRSRQTSRPAPSTDPRESGSTAAAPAKAWRQTSQPKSSKDSNRSPSAARETSVSVGQPESGAKSRLPHLSRVNRRSRRSGFQKVRWPPAASPGVPGSTRTAGPPTT